MMGSTISGCDLEQFDGQLSDWLLSSDGKIVKVVKVDGMEKAEFIPEMQTISTSIPEVQ